MTINFNGIHNGIYMQYFSKRAGALDNYVQMHLNNYGGKHLEATKPLIKKFPSPGDKEGTFLDLMITDTTFPMQDPQLKINGHKIEYSTKNMPIIKDVMKTLALIHHTHKSQFSKHPSLIEDSSEIILKRTGSLNEPKEKQRAIVEDKLNPDNIKKIATRMWNTLSRSMDGVN